MKTPDERVPAVPFAANAVRLSLREWVAAGLIVALLAVALPAAWQRLEPLPPCTNNRLPFRLGNDYWTFTRYVHQAVEAEQTIVLGDSVVWGHYVDTDGTLSAHLNRLAGRERYGNLGIDGIHPAALAGLADCYGTEIVDRRVILHCNLLWTSSPRRDLTERKESPFNHPSLVPQFRPKIPCYREPLSVRLGNVVGRNVRFLSWAKHLQIAYLNGSDWASWTIENPYENPLQQFTLTLPSPDEPPSPPPVREPWTTQGIPPANFRWVDLDHSLQWQSFRRAVDILQHRGNRVFVLVGPFNEHLLTPSSRELYIERKASVRRWLEQRDLPHHVAALLPSELYGDASHPLDAGYALLAERLLADEAFRQFSR